MISLKLHLIQDRAIRDVLKAVENFLNLQSLLRGEWTYIEFNFETEKTNFKLRHNLGFIPRDFIQTYVSGAGTLFINWHNTDREYIDVSATGPCVVRGFLGSYSERGA
jgi:hypothetical protein